MQDLNNVQLMLVAVALLGVSRFVVNLWDSSLEGRGPREAPKGDLHWLLATLRRSVVLAAAWWHERVANFSVWLAHWPTALAWNFSRPLAFKVDQFVQASVCLLLADWLAWFIAGDYLQAKWEDEAGSLGNLKKG